MPLDSRNDCRKAFEKWKSSLPVGQGYSAFDAWQAALEQQQPEQPVDRSQLWCNVCRILESLPKYYKAEVGDRISNLFDIADAIVAEVDRARPVREAQQPVGVTELDKSVAHLASLGDSKCDWMWCYENPKDAAALIDRLNATIAPERESSGEAYIEALTPNAETKAAYIGEFKFDIELDDEDGNPFSHAVTVPWTTIKEIMAAILKRAKEQGRRGPDNV